MAEAGNIVKAIELLNSLQLQGWYLNHLCSVGPAEAGVLPGASP